MYLKVFVISLYIRARIKNVQFLSHKVMAKSNFLGKVKVKLKLERRSAHLNFLGI